jgi:NADPH:quinone reductase-like Zn-dependent oxidoreductase
MPATLAPTMTAIVAAGYGPPDRVLAPGRRPRPQPGPGEVLVRVAAVGLDAGVWHHVRGEAYVARLAFGLRRPRQPVPGRDLAGTVEAVGPGVTALSPGDEVYGEAEGSLAEYVAVPAGHLLPRPAGLSATQAAAVPLSANTALMGLRDAGRVQPGQRVLINGAAGGVGTFAVQLGGWLGAEMIGVCGPGNVELVRSLSATEVIDYTRSDLTRGGPRYDVIFDLIGNHPVSALRRALTPAGTLVLSSGGGGRWLGPMGRVLGAVIRSPFPARTCPPAGSRR